MSLALLFAPFTYSFLSFCLSAFCPSDTRLCGTDTWALSKAVSSKCITTEAVSWKLAPHFSMLLCCLFFGLPPPWSRYLNPWVCFIWSAVISYASEAPLLLSVSLFAPIESLQCMYILFVNKINIFTSKCRCSVLSFYLQCYMVELLSLTHSRNKVYWKTKPKVKRADW